MKCDVELLIERLDDMAYCDYCRALQLLYLLL